MTAAASLITAVVLCVSAYAAGSIYIELPYSVPQGQIFEVTVSVRDNPGFASAQFFVTFNSDSLSFISCRYGTLSDNISHTSAQNSVTISCGGSYDITADGTVATLAFISNVNFAGQPMISVSAASCYDSMGRSVTINGATTVVNISADSVIPENDDSIDLDDNEEVDLGDDEIDLEEDEEIDLDEPEETKATTKATSKTTKKTTAEKVTSKTTTEETTETTTTEAATTETTTTVTTAATEPTKSETSAASSVTAASEATASETASSEQSADDSLASADEIPAGAEVSEDGSKATAGTIAAAISVVIITIAAVAGIEYFKRTH